MFVPQTLAVLFPPKERWLLGGVYVLALLAAMFETLSVASILPFMSLVLDPSGLERYQAIASVVKWFGATSTREALLFLGGATVAVVALGNGAAAMNIAVQERFAARTAVRIATSLFAGYVMQPYGFHVQRDAPSLMKVVLNDVRIAIVAFVSPLLIAASKIFVVIGLLGLLFSQNPLVASVVALVLMSAYLLVFVGVRGRQRRLGDELNRINLDRIRITQEGLGGIKDLQILERERIVIDRFEAAARAAAVTEASNRITALLPRYVLETVAFGGILLVTLMLLAVSEEGAKSVIPVLALYAFAGYKLLPALQQIFASAVSLRFYQPAVLGLRNDFAAVCAKGDARHDEPPAFDLRFGEAIRFEKVSFTYGGAANASLHSVDLVIRPRESIGLVGRSGAGKTTLAEVLLGLYEPSSGTITVDGVSLTGAAIRAWRRRVGYVPQHVFLSNASIAENIAFALPRHAIDAAAVQRAARLAHADDFISSLPEGYDTVVGERGVKLSGGQRQRIGIARALYREPAVLVFDEATSALDGMTEEAVMGAIHALSGDRTVILIAHRLQTVEACDRLVMLEGGRIVADGHYESLLTSSADFRRLIERARTGAMQAID